MPIRQSLLDGLDEPALIVARGRIVAANRAAEEALGTVENGRDVRLAIRHPQALIAIDRGERAEVDLEGLGEVGRSWRLRTRPIGQGELLIRLEDLTAIRASDQQRTDFVADASHELRTPLAAILGYGETLELDDLEPAQRTHFLDRLLGEARRMVTLIDDLFALSRIEAERFVRPTESVDLAALAEASVRDHHALAQAAGAVIEHERANDVPPVLGDAIQLRQLVDNLVANAIRYGCPVLGGKVTVALIRQGERVRLEVYDDGPGVSAEQLPRLTQRFFRADSARGRESGGTGLGLAIARRIAERHRTELRLANRSPHGLIAFVDLPLVT